VLAAIPTERRNEQRGKRGALSLNGNYSQMLHALIVNEDGVTANLLSELARSESYSVIVVGTIGETSIQCQQQTPAIVFISHTLADGRASDWLDRFKRPVPFDVVLVGDNLSAIDIVEAFRSGITDLLLKPVDRTRVRHLLRQRITRQVDNSAHNVSMYSDIRALQTESSRSVPTAQTSLLGESPAMKALRHQIDRVAPTEASVLLLGESGTGKELVAKTIHAKSKRSRQAFLPVNCGAISPQLIESEIFGHEKGSFTGADRQHKGYFERASGGTLFLDEVVEMPIDLQVKLLRVLETGTFMRIGSSQELKTDVRIVAATNRDPEAAISEGRLRLDLYHRLNVFPVRVPPLRERGSDIELLAQYFLDELNHELGTHKQMSATIQHSLGNHHWPGNVRELRNFIQRAYILSEQSLDLSTPEQSVMPSDVNKLTLAIPVGTSLADVDRKLIFATLESCGGVKKRTADILGISLKTLYNRLEEYNRSGTALRRVEGSKMTHVTHSPTTSDEAIASDAFTSLNPAKVWRRLPVRDSGLLN
jgi:DNA-binding NtrC family response regulator